MEVASMQSNLTDGEWITISEAAKAFGRTRQAIDQHVKTGKVESKRMGNKQVVHVNKQSLNNLLVSFAKPILTRDFKQLDGKKIDESETSNLLLLYRHLLEKSEREISELKIELSKSREENRENQREVFKLMSEVKSILNKETGLTSWIRTFKK